MKVKKFIKGNYKINIRVTILTPTVNKYYKM